MHDGLHIARIDFLTDKPITNGKSEFKNTYVHFEFSVELFKKLENEVYQLAKQWFIALSNTTKVS